MTTYNERIRAAIVSLTVNLLLSGLKLAGALFTGSVSLLSEAFHSLTDVIASSISLASIHAAAAPPDEDHPYGHAKIENVASLAEAILLALLALFVMATAVRHLLTGAALSQPKIGILLLLISACCSATAGWYVRKVGRATNSPALASNGLHLLSDFVTSISVVVALIIVAFTRWQWIDGAFGLALGIWLLLSSYRIGSETFQQLIDRRLPDEDIARIVSLIQTTPGLVSFHRLRTRLSGSLRYIDFHIVLPNDWSLVQSHEVADNLEKQMKEELDPAFVVIHVDPFDAKKLAAPEERISVGQGQTG